MTAPVRFAKRARAVGEAGRDGYAYPAPEGPACSESLAVSPSCTHCSMLGMRSAVAAEYDQPTGA